MEAINEPSENKAPPGFINPSSGAFDYFESKVLKFCCPKCAWFGSGSLLEVGEVFADLQELECPRCATYIACVSFPTLQDNRDNWDQLSQTDKTMHAVVSEMQANFLSKCLKSSDQLPERPGQLKFHLFWDADGADTVIKHGDEVLFREPTLFEGYERYTEVALILKAKYQDRLTGLHPTQRSEMDLYGDQLGARDYLKRFQLEMFGESSPRAAG